MEIPVFKTTAGFVALLAFATIATAEPTPPPAPPAPPAAPAKPAEEKKICVTEEVTGSRLGGKRVCMTKSEFDERQIEARKELDQNTRVHTAGNPN